MPAIVYSPVVVSAVPPSVGSTSGTYGGSSPPSTTPSLHPMNVAGLLEKLSFGPLSNLAIGGDGSGTCDPAKVPALITYANDALVQLFSKFILNERNLVVMMHDVITTYKLTSLRARTVTPTDPLQVQYIIDSPYDPFSDDLIKVLQIFDDAGREIILNDQTVYGSIFTPKYNVLQIPIPVDGQPLYVTYQAKHAVLDPTALGMIVDVPDVLVEALTSYIAHKVLFHMNGQEHSMKAKEHLDKYNAIIAEVQEKDLVNSSSSTNRFPKFYERGFR